MVADPTRGLPSTHKYPQLADVKAACEAAYSSLARNSVRQRAVFHPPSRPATAQDKARVQAMLDVFKRDMAKAAAITELGDQYEPGAFDDWGGGA